ncbi:MAG: GNAT family N-acetyltransferase [Thermoproteota archaeon]
MEYSPLTEGLVAKVAKLVNRSLEFEAVTPWTVSRCTILDPNFDPKLTIVALDEGEPVGIVIGAIRSKAPQEMAGNEHGWIKLAAVNPRYGGTGLADRLLLYVEKGLKSRGAKDVRVSDFAGWYFWPGVDVRYQGLIRFFYDHGYGKVSESLECEVCLAGLRTPSLVLEREVNLAKEGYAFSTASQDKKEEVAEWVHSNFGPLWSHEVSEAFRHSPPSVLLASKEGKTVGFAAYSALELDWFGPIGVVEGERRKGIGSVLLFKSLANMREDGRKSATIPCGSYFSFFSRVPLIRGVRNYWILYKKL